MTIHDGTHVRRDAEFYPTLDAADVVRVLLDHVELPPGTIWEPHAGAGHLVKALRDRNLHILASDLHDHPSVPGLDVDIFAGIDFLDAGLPCPKGVKTIMMNPPYGGERRYEVDLHVQRALDLMRGAQGVVVLLARSDWSYAGRRKAFVRDAGFALKLELAWRLRWVEGTSESGKHNYAIYVWDFRPEAARDRPMLGHGYR